MSNQSIADDVLAVLENFRAARLTATDVEDAVERAVQAMENVSLRDIHRSETLLINSSRPLSMMKVKVPLLDQRWQMLWSLCATM